MRLVRLTIRQKSEFHQFLIGNIIQSEEVSSSFLDGIAVGLQRVWVRARQELSASVSQTLMQVCMQVITQVAILFNHRQRLLVNDKFFFEAIAVSGLIIGISDVRNSDALATMLSSYPVSIRQIDANSR